MSALDTSLPGSQAVKRINVMQGEAKASDDAQIELTTVLGSCVATCLFDPVARVGGMNHFLLAEPVRQTDDMEFDEHYGLFLMELLVNEVVKIGALKRRLKARLYCGANINSALLMIGTSNANFAREFLRREGIEKSFEDLEGRHARRVHFRPSSGLVRCRQAIGDDNTTQKRVQPQKSAIGDVELF